ncbi:cytochrome P450 2M1-like [Oncorhynchus tshawytscha]|uniref:cytochrome P450 2M1-like n=1 Tax=Oncorhynchus tshawytscha TaxID=74940 RepID=UPI001C3E3D3F|nr:cytochrome P450 2M1-like [Oncorhynchus tshawytscha]
MAATYILLYNISPRIVECFPGKHQELFKAIDKAKAYIRLEADRRLKSLDTSNPQDYFDVFLVKMLEEKDQPGTEFNYDNLFPCVWDLFAASTETLSSTLSHACLMMIKYPDIQEKVQKEIDEVIGSNRVPTADDRHKMPYTEAVIHEIQRSMCLAPTAVPHQMTRDTTFHNYHIPKGTTVFPLLSSVLFDPKLFKKPDEFYPENFLDENGRFKENNGFLAFGLGKIMLQVANKII